MQFTKYLKETSIVYFEHNGNLNQFPPSSYSHHIDANIERISMGNFVLKITHEYIITQDNKQVVIIITASEFSIVEDALISFKPDTKICVEAVKIALEYTKNYLYNNSKDIFFKENYIMLLPEDDFITFTVNTTIRTMT